MTREDAISIMKVIVHMLEEKYDTDRVEEAVDMAIEALQQKPICPSSGVDCEDCPAYEDTISRKAVLNTLENMDRALDEDRTVESYKDLLRECYKVLPSVTPKPKSECEHDHEILKAYSDGANAVLDKIRDEIEQMNNLDYVEPVTVHEVLQIIDKHIEEVNG